MKKLDTMRLLVLVALVVAAMACEASAAERPNKIQVENEKPGTTEWILTKIQKGPKPPLYAPADEPYDKGWRRRKQVEGYCSHTSIRAGETLKVYVSTEPAAQYRVDIYRMGYYQGKGGRLVQTLGPFQGVAQPTPEDGERNLKQCKWSEGFRLQIPQEWVSGVYLGKLSTTGTEGEAYVIFILRDDRKADLVFQCSDLTWLSYNRWPNWRSLYDNGPNPWGASSRRIGYDVGFDRPYAIYWNGFPAGFEPLTNGSGEFLMIEHPLAFWLEKEGYDVTYLSNVDTHADGKGLLRGKAFVSVGHDEYWTAQMVENLKQARDAGVNLAFLSGNALSGLVELRPSTDGRPNRAIRRVGDLPNEEDLLGAKSYGVGFADWTCAAPNHWVFEGTGMKKGDRVAQLVGWEYHGQPLARHEGLEVLSSGPVYGWNGQRLSTTYATTIYPWKKGNLVFNAGTCWWNMVLSTPPGFMNPPRRSFQEDPRIQRITKNVLDRMIAKDLRPDAPGSDLEQSIEKVRTGVLVVEAAPGVEVRVEQLRHEFWFGAALASQFFGSRTGKAEDAARYKKAFLENFNAAVTENALKWHAMERRRGEADYSTVEAILQWTKEHDVPLRGHNIFWGVPNMVQPWLKDLDDTELRATLKARALDVGRRYRGRFAEYDLNNEMLHGNLYADRLGPEITRDMALWVRQEDPAAVLYLNDYDILTGRRLNDYVAQIREFLDQGVPVGGIGVQGHLHGDSFDPVALQSALDRLAQFKLPIRVTEFNFPGQRSKYYGKRGARLTDEEERAKAKALADYYRICFANPAVEGVLMWGFWEGANWIPVSSLYRRDWSATPAAEAYRDLVFKQWWTSWRGKTDAQGRCEVRAFFGNHRVTAGGKEFVVHLKRGEQNKRVSFKQP